MIGQWVANGIVNGTNAPAAARLLSPLLEQYPQLSSVVLSDERWVPEYHEDSNAGMLRREFLIDKASTCRFTSLYCDTRSPIDGTAEVSRAVDALPATATVTLLGMGKNGHVASLFPNAPDLANILASTGPVESVFPVGLNAPRMTLTPRRLLATRSLVLLLFGQEKLDVFRQAQQPGSVEDLPVRLFLQQSNIPLRLFWAP